MPMWDAGFAGNSLTHFTTALVWQVSTKVAGEGVETCVTGKGDIVSSDVPKI